VALLAALSINKSLCEFVRLIVPLDLVNVDLLLFDALPPEAEDLPPIECPPPSFLLE
jgi:hypothetical protein